MKVSLGMPFWGKDLTRKRNFDYCWPLMSQIWRWHDAQWRVPIDVETRGAARNWMVRQLQATGADVVVLCDADTFVEQDALLVAVNRAATGGLHFAYNGYRYLSPASTDRVVSGDFDRLFDLPTDMQGPGSLGGCMAIDPQEWWSAGGSPELTGWGFEDVIFAVQARTLLSADLTWSSGWLYHLYHPSECHPGSEQYQVNIRECREYEQADGQPMLVRKLINDREQKIF